jgi:hypothetical protein
MSQPSHVSKGRLVVNNFNQDDWMAHCVETLKPGWRGRLRLFAPEELESADCEELFGTVMSEMEADLDPDSDSIVDAVFTFQTNYHDGLFVPLPDQPSVDIRVSRVAGMEEM